MSDSAEGDSDYSNRPPDASRDVRRHLSVARPTLAGRRSRHQPVGPDRRDITTDRGDAFYLWKERWPDYELMSQLRLEEPAVQLANLRTCLSDETLGAIRNLPLTEAERYDIDVILSHIETYAIRAQEAAARDASGICGGAAVTCHVRHDGTHGRDPTREPSSVCRTCHSGRDGGRGGEGTRRRDSRERQSPRRLRSPEHRGSAGWSPGRREATRRSPDRREAPGSSSGRRYASPCEDMDGYGAGRPRAYHDPERGTPGRRSAAPRMETCGRCGLRQHRRPADCPARGRECRRCQELGHFEAVCRASPIRRRDGGPDDGCDDNAGFTAAIIATAENRGAPRIGLRARAKPDGHFTEVSALPDTGADVTVAGLNFMRRLGEIRENLKRRNMHPRAADGKTIRSAGTHDVSKPVTGTKCLRLAWDLHDRGTSTDDAALQIVTRERPRGTRPGGTRDGG